MLIPQQYPLVDDLGLRSARQRWVEFARRDRTRARLGAIAAAIGLPLMFGVLGILPWVLQRATMPGRLQEHMSRNMPMGNAHLGAEYYNIAAAIHAGRGFADPFVVESGPTAWMPPLLVWIQAGLIWLFDGDRYWVMLAVVFLKTNLLCACGAAIVYQGRRNRNGWMAFGVLAAFLVTDFFACFKFTHDGWLILAGVTATAFGLPMIDRLVAAGKLTIAAVIGWGLLGGLIALSSPVAGFTWAAGTTLCLLRRAPLQLAMAALMSMAVVAPWAVRNKVVLGRFVPIKSNVFFELDQSMALDDDGLLDWNTMSSHPYHQGPEQDAYVQMGEIDYLETKKDRFLNQVLANPTEFRRKVRNRLIGTTLWPAGFSGFHSPLRWALYPWPAVSVIFLIVCCRPLSRLQRWTIVVYIAYLIPYVACSYYPRYGFPLIPVKILLCYWALERVVAKVRQSQGQLA